MSDFHIRPRTLQERIALSAQMAFEANHPIEKIPADMIEHAERWCQEYRLCQFEVDCGRAA